MSKTVLFVCATGIATSTAVTEKVKAYCDARGVSFSYRQLNVAALPNNVDDADLIVSTTNVPYELDLPIIHGLPLITGIGEDQVLRQILKILQKE